MKWSIALIIYTLLMLGIIAFVYLGLIVTQLRSIPCYDSIGHFVLYGTWGYLFAQTFTRPMFIFRKIIFQEGIVIMIAIAIIEESLQVLSPRRTFSLFDLGWGLLGIMTACLFIHYSKKKLKLL